MIVMTDIKAIREKLKMSQAEMADRLGVHQSTLSRFETGVLPVDKRTELAVTALQASTQQSAA